MNANRFVFNKVNPTPNTVRPLADFLKEQEMILDKLVRVIDAEFKALKERGCIILSYRILLDFPKSIY